MPDQSPSKTLATPRQPGFGDLVTRLFEAVGVLNKGSAASAATPPTDVAAQTTGVSNNALNVTRVGGLASLVTVVGSAAFAIFKVSNQPVAVKVAGYASVGVIIAAALITAAIITSADIRSRTVLNAQAASPSAASATPASQQATDAGSFKSTWYQALSMLHAAVDIFDAIDEPRWMHGGVTNAQIQADAAGRLTNNLHPDPDQATLHAKLQAGQAKVVSLLQGATGFGGKAQISDGAKVALAQMDQDLPWP
jgi:hypothetical protein